jgi:glutathione-regulated potassium-efflux system ancillary protein KefC
VREHFPHLQIVARARNVSHVYALHQLGVTLIERETLDSALMSARSVLELMGWQPHAARTRALQFRQHSVDLMYQMAPHFGDESKLIAVAKQGRAQLEETWARDHAQNKTQQAREGWVAPVATGATVAKVGRSEGD